MFQICLNYDDTHDDKCEDNEDGHCRDEGGGYGYSDSVCGDSDNSNDETIIIMMTVITH